MFLDFQKLKKDLENLEKVNFRKKTYFSHFSHNFSKIDIISDVIIPITAILIFFSTSFFVTLQSMTVPINVALFYCYSKSKGLREENV